MGENIGIIRTLVFGIFRPESQLFSPRISRNLKILERARIYYQTIWNDETATK